MNNRLETIIDLKKYPINDTGSLKYGELTNYTRKQLNEDGCCILPDFIKPDSIRRMKNEVDKNLSKIYFTSDKHNPYFTKDDRTLPEDHPKNIFSVRQSGYLNSNELKIESDLNKFYDLEEMLKFVSDSLEVFPLYKWADPLGKNPYSVMYTDHYFPWHFDGNEFTLSILVQKAEKGGLFEYAPDLRSKDNENFEEVTKVLKGDRKKVKSLDLKPGDLQINVMKGKKLTNMRTQGTDENVVLTPVRKMSIAEQLSILNTDEALEITPKSCRLRKAILNPHERKKSEKASASAA